MLSTFGIATHARTDEEAAERRVKAAYLYKFAGYVEWPESAFANPDAPIVIAVAGPTEIVDELERIVAGRALGSRAIEVRRFREGDALSRVHVLYASRTDGGAAPPAIRASANLPILVVSDAAGALAQGSVINFSINEGKVRFEVSMESAEKRGIKLSSRLLAAATNLRLGSN